MQISKLKDRKPNELSGGQQQRVALARAFVIEPGVLLMDEPLSNLDAKLRVQMRTVIKKLQRRLGITTIYVTHDQEEALAISDRIAVMKEGNIMQVGTPEEIYCGMKRRSKKQFKRNKKEYSRFSDHIGFLPLVMVSPADSELIAGGSEERRRFMDVVISQYDKEYLEALIRYNKALAQRNTLLKSEFPVEEELFLVWEEMMAQAGAIVFQKREAFIREFIPIFQSFYSFISQDKEVVGLSYESHARDASLLEVLKQSRERDKIMGFSLRGIHKDELNMLLGEFPIKKEGSQGQNKTYLVALKLAQFDFLKRTGRTVPLLLLDDIFDKLDASRVEQIVKLVAGDNFGQIFITDTNRGHLDRILHKVGSDYKIFRVEEGTIQETEADNEAQ